MISFYCYCPQFVDKDGTLRTLSRSAGQEAVWGEGQSPRRIRAQRLRAGPSPRTGPGHSSSVGADAGFPFAMSSCDLAQAFLGRGWFPRPLHPLTGRQAHGTHRCPETQGTIGANSSSQKCSVLTTKKHVLFNGALSTYHAKSRTLQRNHLQLKGHASSQVPSPSLRMGRTGALPEPSVPDENTKAFPSAPTPSRWRRMGVASARRRRDAGHGVGITVSHALPQTCHAWGGAQGTAGAPARSPRPPGEGFGVAVRGKRRRSRGAGPPAGSAAPSHWTGGRGAAPRCGWGSRTRTPECIWKGRVDRQVEMCALDLSCDEAARNKPTLSLDARG